MLNVLSLCPRRLFAVAALAVFVGCGPSAEEDARVCANVQCTAGRCVAEDGQPVCQCSAWEEAAGLTCQLITSAEREPDDHGDTPAAATALSSSSGPVEARISPRFRDVVDRDVFAVATEPGHSYRFTCTARTVGTCHVRLLDANGRDVEPRFDGPQPQVRRSFAAANEPRFIEVSAGNDTASGTYTYQLEDLGPDDHGDARERATALQPSSEPFPVTIGYPGDLDVFIFRSVADHGYRFSCEPRELGLSLESAQGATVDSGSWLGTARMQAVGLNTSAEASWFVVARSEGAALPLQATCRLEDLGRDEHADGLSGATPLTLGVPMSARSHGKDDVDVFSFNGTAGHVYRVSTVVHAVRLTDAAGVELGMHRTDTSFHELPASGTYFLHVGADASWGQDSQLVVEDLGLDDHGGTPERATLATLGTPVQVLIHKAVDLDAVAYDVEEDGIYRLTCEPRCSFQLSAPSGHVYRMMNGLDGSWIINASATERLTAIFDSSAGAPLPFTLTVERVGTDDHGDDAAHATPLTLPASMSGVFEPGADADVFSAVLEAGRTYLFHDHDVRVSVFAPDGQDVAYTQSRFTAAVSGTYVLRVFPTNPSPTQSSTWRFSFRAE